MVRLRSITLALVLLSCGLVVAPAYGWDKCGTTSDCKGKGICEEGSCGHCASNADCKVGDCDKGRCGYCGTDSDCHGGTCSNHKCSNAEE
jgi:hypothetical protein